MSVLDLSNYPTLSRAGQRFLRQLQEHPHAPRLHNSSGNRLTSNDVATLRNFLREVTTSSVTPNPSWLNQFAGTCLEQVPFYRHYGLLPEAFEQLPTISRADLSRDITAFIPDHIEANELIMFSTSGTTGHPLIIPSLPLVAAKYLPFHLKALQRFGIIPQHGSNQVGIMLIGYQQRCFTYISVNPLLNESGLLKLNLHPDDWRSPADRQAFLDDLQAEFYSGDPLSLSRLAELPTQHCPRAILSTSMALLPGLRQQLEKRFNCPLLDIYSMNEAGPIAVYDPTCQGHVLLQHCLHVEILDPEGRLLTYGERGEITISGGFNNCLPLLRYRTGDYASMVLSGNNLVLNNLEGRPPVLFQHSAGHWLNNIEVTHALSSFALPQFALHQNRDKSLVLSLAQPCGTEPQLRAALHQLFGPTQLISICYKGEFSGKVVQYTSDLQIDKETDSP